MTRLPRGAIGAKTALGIQRTTAAGEETLAPTANVPDHCTVTCWWAQIVARWIEWDLIRFSPLATKMKMARLGRRLIVAFEPLPRTWDTPGYPW